MRAVRGNGGRLRGWAAGILWGVLAILSAVGWADENLTYDANGNVLTRALPLGSTTYDYDDLDRLRAEAGPAKTQTLIYDANGNRLGDAGGSHTYVGNSNRPLTIAGQGVIVDGTGRITQMRGLGLVWNQAGQLKEVRQGSPGGPLVASYFYDYKGRRSRKVVSGMGSLTARTTLYLHDQEDRLIGELNGAGTPLRTYVWQGPAPVAIIDHSAGSVLYLETDHLGTPIAARNEEGTVVWRWESDAFGATAPSEDPGDGGQARINLRFPGQYYDKESGLHYNGHRYYDPKTGRYISPDPIGLAGGINTYSYVGGNPLSLIDPEGLMGQPSGAQAGASYPPGQGPGSFPPSTITITVTTGLPGYPIKPPETKTYSTSCMVKLGIGVKGSLMAAGATAGKYGPPLLQSWGLETTAAVASRAAAFSASPVGWALGGLGLIDYVDEKCQCPAQ